jgi:transposase InsO family protein
LSVPLQPHWEHLHRAGLTLANPYVEFLGGRLRDQLLAVEAFSSLLEARVPIEDWRIEYNTARPHSALGYRTPSPVRPSLDHHQPALS